MAAGQGFKTFTTGEVLTAGDVNGYLMQGINVFHNTSRHLYCLAFNSFMCA